MLFNVIAIDANWVDKEKNLIHIKTPLLNNLFIDTLANDKLINKKYAYIHLHYILIYHFNPDEQTHVQFYFD